MFTMMGKCVLPYHLEVYGVKYWMRTRGYWDGSHFWCKVIRTVRGMTAVWYHNDMVNDGNAALISTDLQHISGALPMTSLAMYTRNPTPDESIIIEAANDKIKKSHLEIQGNILFSQTLKSDQELRTTKLERDRGDNGNVTAASLLASLTPEEIVDLFASDGNTEEEGPSIPKNQVAKPNKKVCKRKTKAREVLAADELELDGSISKGDKQPLADEVACKIKVLSSNKKGRKKLEVTQTKDTVSDSKTNGLRLVAKKAKGWKGYAIVEEFAIEESDKGEEEQSEKKERNPWFLCLFYNKKPSNEKVVESS
ncbi:hypothetical protein DFH28DRAFT_1128028 [Melampsora americana]|nr:hypothetical protein DFH28DRAFT_1128028 [Melampsora americana]